MAEAVEAILHHEKIPEATLVGHSMGGYVCLALIEKNPKLCHNLLLLNSNTVSDSEEKAANRDRAIQLLKTHREAYIKMAISNLFAETTRLAFEPEIEALKEMAMQFPVQGIIAALEGMKIRKDHTQLLKKQKFPKHFIAGKNDPIMPSEDLKQMAHNTHAFFYEIDGGHMSTIENRIEVLELFRKII